MLATHSSWHSSCGTSKRATCVYTTVIGVSVATACSGLESTRTTGKNEDAVRPNTAGAPEQEPTDAPPEPDASPAQHSGPASPQDALRFPAATVAPFEARCGNGALTEQGATALQRAPYLQQLDADSVVVLYKLKARATADPDVLELWTQGGAHVADVPVQPDDSAPDGRQRVARVSGLTSDTLYYYALPGLTERIGFRTAPAPGASTPARFVVIGDSGTGSTEQAALRDRFATMQFDFLLHAGDIAYADGTLEQFEQFYFGMYEGLLKSVASFPVPGNHEYRTDHAAPFVEVFELPDNGVKGARDRWFSFDWGNVHLVGLDTQQLHPEQIEWLERDLGNNQWPWVVAYLHRPPFSSGRHGGAADVRDAFAPVFERHGVALVLSGHDHNYERTLPIHGVTYVVTGGGGRGLRSVGASSFTAHSESAFHFVSVVIDGNTLDLRAIDPSGRELDSVQIHRAALVPTVSGDGAARTR